MRFCVYYDDGIYAHSAVVEAPARTDEFDLLEIATREEYFRRNRFNKGYVEGGELERELRADGFRDEEIEEYMYDVWYSPMFDCYLCA